MKSLLFLMLFLYSETLVYAQEKSPIDFIRTSYKEAAQFNVLALSVADGYALSQSDTSFNNQHIYQFEKKDAEPFVIVYNGRIIGADPDMGIKGKLLVGEIIVQGNLVTLLPFYKKWVSENIDLEQAKKYGRIKAPQSALLFVSFYRIDENKGIWNLEFSKQQ